MNLDDLLASLQTAAADGVANLPLLDVGDFVDAAPNAGELSVSGAHAYVGCIGRWLHTKKALLSQDASGVAIQDNLLSPADFSRQVLHGRLSAADVTHEFREFATKYVRDLGIYGHDYTDTLVVPLMKRSLFEVENTEDTYDRIAPEIESRYQRFVEGDANWASTKTTYQQVQLSAEEKNVEGWLQAFRISIELETLLEKHRRDELNHFWALVDYSPNIASDQVVILLLKTFSKSADSSVQQSVLNALAAMPFEIVMPEVLRLSSWLSDTGWLPEILGCWRGAFTD
jgi:hypothetical protein